MKQLLGIEGLFDMFEDISFEDVDGNSTRLSNF